MIVVKRKHFWKNNAAFYLDNPDFVQKTLSQDQVMVLKAKILKEMKDWHLNPKGKRVIACEQYEKNEWKVCGTIC